YPRKRARSAISCIADDAEAKVPRRGLAGVLEHSPVRHECPANSIWRERTVVDNRRTVVLRANFHGGTVPGADIVALEHESSAPLPGFLNDRVFLCALLPYFRIALEVTF